MKFIEKHTENLVKTYDEFFKTYGVFENSYDVLGKVRGEFLLENPSLCNKKADLWYNIIKQGKSWQQ